jgi:hypothetical protein
MENKENYSEAEKRAYAQGVRKGERIGLELAIKLLAKKTSLTSD